MVGHSRRDLLRIGLGGGLAVAFGGWPAFAQARREPPAAAPRARAVLHVFLSGGLSHLDTFDPKPHAPAEVRGPFKTVRSKIDGEPLSELAKRIAGVADHLAIIRSLAHGEADHDRGYHTMLTGYPPSPAIVYPSLGSVVAHELRGQDGLPPYVAIPDARFAFSGPGYLSSAFAPFSIGGEPRARGFKVRDLAASVPLDAGRAARRRRLLAGVNEGFAGAGRSDATLALQAFYRQAYELIDSAAARAAFDVAAEPPALRERYGMNDAGQRLLLARRLVEGGVRFVMARVDGFDHHRNIAGELPRRFAEVDQAFAALIEDCAARGLLDDVLVVLTSEFGRTPRINGDAGRDHWPRAFSAVLAGAGIQRGVVFGASSADGSEPERDPVKPADLAATVFHLAGIDPARKLLSPGDRPIDIVRDGAPIRGVLR